jgi:hypothetical protein
MKHLKTYEKTYENNVNKSNNKIFYYIQNLNNDNLFKLAVNKLDTTDKIKKDIFNDLRVYELFIATPGVSDEKFSYWIINQDKERGYQFYKHLGYQYREIILEDWEIAAHKYNL